MPLWVCAARLSNWSCSGCKKEKSKLIFNWPSGLICTHHQYITNYFGKNRNEFRYSHEWYVSIVYMATGSWPRCSSNIFFFFFFFFFKLMHKIDDYPSRMYRSSAHSWILRIKTSFLFLWVIFFLSSSFIQKTSFFFAFHINAMVTSFHVVLFVHKKCALFFNFSCCCYLIL